MNFTIVIIIVLLWAVMPVSGWSQTQICIPQFADGLAGPYRWQTSLIFRNQEHSQAQVQIQFYRPMGQMIMNGRGFGSQFQLGSNGLFIPGPIGPGAMVAYRSGGQRALQSGFCIINSTARIQAQVMFHLYDLLGNLLSETGIIPTGGLTSAAFFIDHTESGRVGLALANPSAETANITLEIHAPDGSTPLSTKTIQLASHAHLTQFVDETFPSALVDSVGYLRITSSTTICAMAIRITGTTISPVALFVNE